MLGLGEIEERYPASLSRGERKLLAIARVLCKNPEILILNEPMSGLDSCVRRRLLELLTWLGEGGKTIILGGHDPELVEKFASRIVILGEDHRILADGPPGDVVRDYNLMAKAALLHDHIHRHGGQIHQHPHVHEKSLSAPPLCLDPSP
jgi:cobalt/nickel transport system ATP-binding protein